MNNRKCCVPGCLEDFSRRLHSFPNPYKDKERFDSWVSAIGGPILDLNDDHIHKHRRVCHNHFDQKYCCRFRRICNTAVPTLDLPGPLLKFQPSERRERKPSRQIEILEPSIFGIQLFHNFQY